MALITSAQATKINNSMKALQDVALGTILRGVKDQASLVAMNKITATVGYADFTDGEGAAGTYTLTETIPQGAVVYAAVLEPALTGFAGDTSATIQVGDGTDVDRYSTGTPDVFSDVAGGMALGAVSGTAYHAAAKAPVITITVDSDWTSVTAGELTLAIYYFA